MAIIPKQFPLITQQDINKPPDQLQDPIKYKYRSVLFVAEDAQMNVKGLALLLHMPTSISAT